jgi:hypothetical protein
MGSDVLTEVTDAATGAVYRHQGDQDSDTWVQVAIRCPRCQRTSWHPQDIAFGYCGACHTYTQGKFVLPEIDAVNL